MAALALADRTCGTRSAGPAHSRQIAVPAERRHLRQFQPRLLARLHEQTELQRARPLRKRGAESCRRRRRSPEWKWLAGPDFEAGNAPRAGRFSANGRAGSHGPPCVARGPVPAECPLDLLTRVDPGPDARTSAERERGVAGRGGGAPRQTRGACVEFTSSPSS